ncbi:MAG TPA: hypothetical protein VEZ11_04655 [Thermoanaerobaculia bacterium]|nr:hypothetical protein [Thermoanaerobaculia bacterium]
MTPGLQLIGRIGAVVSFVACLGAGVWLLWSTGINHKDDALSTALGLYFIGKAFFVGPMLAIASCSR